VDCLPDADAPITDLVSLKSIYLMHKPGLGSDHITWNQHFLLFLVTFVDTPVNETQVLLSQTHWGHKDKPQIHCALLGHRSFIFYTKGVKLFYHNRSI